MCKRLNSIFIESRTVAGKSDRGKPSLGHSDDVIALGADSNPFDCECMSKNDTEERNRKREGKRENRQYVPTHLARSLYLECT